MLRAHEQAGSFAERPAVDELAGRPLQRGDRLGPYEIVELLGAGGMGEVYRARDTKLGRDVAIKVLPPLFTADADRLARFDREARTLASLNHPHILTVHDVGELDGRPYLVTEFVDGGTLKTWTRSDTRTWRQSRRSPGRCRRRPGRRARGGHRPPGRQAGQHPRLEDMATPSSPTSGWRSCSRPSAARRRRPTVRRTHAAGHDRRDDRLHVARAGRRQTGRRAQRHLFVRRRPLRGCCLDVSRLPGRPNSRCCNACSTTRPSRSARMIPLALRMVVEKALEKDPAERYQSMRDMVVDLRRLSRQTGETRRAGHHALAPMGRAWRPPRSSSSRWVPRRSGG